LALPVAVLEGAADAEACAELRRLLPPTVSASPFRHLSLPQAAALLQRCRLYVGNDSGVSHLAGRLGVPTAAVFGPTDPAVWRPLGPHVQPVAAAGHGWPSVQAVLRAARAVTE
jgi:ADP-heptose:LPS heptosyltransferase